MRPESACGRLERDLGCNELVGECLERLAALDLPDWYLGGGCIAQTIWNVAHANPAATGIDDYDIAYFDTDLSARAESDVVACVCDLLSDLPIRPDVKNQARVHLWYASRFGYEIRPYSSCEDALASWPTTAAAIGVRQVDGTLIVEAPFGTDDLLDLVVRPNRVQITPAIYAAKVERWRRVWPLLQILPWEDGVGVAGIRREGPVDVSLRPVSPADLPTIDRWASHMADRMSRTRPSADGADQHDPGSGLSWYVIAEAGVDVGTVWIELPPAGSEAVLGIFLSDASSFGRGIGTTAVGLAVAEFRRQHRQVPIVLRVRRSNARAIACYRRAGFSVTGSGSKPLPSGEAVPYFRMTYAP